MEEIVDHIAALLDPTAAVERGSGPPPFSELADGHSSLYVGMLLQEELKRAGASECVPERSVRCDPCAEDGRGMGRCAAAEDLRSAAVVRPLHRCADANVDPGGKEGFTLVDADAPIFPGQMATEARAELRTSAGNRCQKRQQNRQAGHVESLHQ